MIASSSIRRISASVGISPLTVLPARSRNERSFERDRPAPRSSSSDAARICSAVGSAPGKQRAEPRENRRRGLAGELLIDDRLRQRGKDARRPIELQAKRPDRVDDASQEASLARRCSTAIAGSKPIPRAVSAIYLHAFDRQHAAALSRCRLEPKSRPILPPAANTRWQGTTIGNGFRPSACPTARAAPRASEPRRNLAIGERPPRRDRARDLEHAAMKRRHVLHIQRDGRKIVSAHRAAARQCRQRRPAPRRRRRFRRGRKPVQHALAGRRLARFGKLHADHAPLTPGDPAPADRRSKSVNP